MKKEQESSESSERTFVSEFKRAFKRRFKEDAEELSHDPVGFFSDPFISILKILLILGAGFGFIAAIDYFFIHFVKLREIDSYLLMFIGFFCAVTLSIIVPLNKINNTLKEIKDKMK